MQFVPAYVAEGFGARGRDFSYQRWADAYAREGIEICAVAGYVNLLHPDPEKRRRNRDAFASFLQIASSLGCRYVATETGSYATTSDWDFHPMNHTREAWDDLRRLTAELLEVARSANAVILYEPYVVNVCRSAELGAALVREFDSPHLGLVMDPTNWFTSELARRECVDDVLERGFAAERGLFHLAHAKDVAPAMSGAREPSLPPPGKGILNYGRYLALLREHEYSGPLVIEHVTEDEVSQALRFVTCFIEGTERPRP